MQIEGKVKTDISIFLLHPNSQLFLVTYFIDDILMFHWKEYVLTFIARVVRNSDKQISYNDKYTNN